MGRCEEVQSEKEEEMRITRRQLRKIITEEMAHPRHGLGKNIADVDFPIVVGYNDRSEIAYNQDELDDILDMITGGPGSSTNIPYSLDSLEDMEPKDRPVGADIERFAEGKVEIKGSRIQQLIKEAVLKESRACKDNTIGDHGMKIRKNELRRIIKEAVLAESGVDANKRAMELLSRDYDVVSDDTRYPYGRYRGDVRKTTIYARKDKQPVPEADISLLKDRDAKVRKDGGSMAALSGVYTSKLSDDGSQIVVNYYRHTAG